MYTPHIGCTDIFAFSNLILIVLSSGKGGIMYIFKKMRQLTICFFLMLAMILLPCFSVTSQAAVSRDPRLNIKSLYMTKKAFYRLRVYNISEDYSVSFSSSDSDVVSIRSSNNTSCRLKARTSGSAVVSAVLCNNTTQTTTTLKCKVTVSPPAVSIKFKRKKVRLAQNNIVKLKYTIKPGISTEQPLFYSDDPSIVSISSTGIITGVAPGKTSVHVQIANGRLGTCVVTVTSPTTPSQSPSPSPSATFEPDGKAKENTSPVIRTRKPEEAAVPDR